MKLLITLELALLLLATTFQSHNPPGWYNLQLPVSDLIQDIQFIDSLVGWTVTGDNGYILKTTNGGENWSVQEDSLGRIMRVQFLNPDTGYVLNFYGNLYKTTNGGSVWNLKHSFHPAGLFRDMFFVDAMTGWACSNDIFDGGLFKTIDGGSSWFRQLYGSFKPKNIFFLNNDTGWILCDTDVGNSMYRTLNGGTNWLVVYAFPFGNPPVDLYFFDFGRGVAASGVSLWTSNGGANWTMSNLGGINLTFVDEKIGWAGWNGFNVLAKSTDGGRSWFTQSSPNFSNDNVSCASSMRAWAGRVRMARTTDGGGLTSIVSANSEIPSAPELEQNFPNPFNPITQIGYRLQRTGIVIIRVFDSRGKFIEQLVNEMQMAGTYQVAFDGSGLSSGVYFYELNFRDSENSDNRFSISKKMLLLK